MARTAAAGLLTVQHRRAQLQLRGAALRDYLAVWPLWDGTDETFQRLVAATVPLVQTHHRLSAAVAAAYYQSFRQAERPGGSPTPRLASIDQGLVAGTLYLTGREMTRRALAAGHSPQAAMQTALVRTTGTVGRLVLAGGRDTLVQSVDADPRAAGYERILSPGACEFCQSVADETTGDFAAHDHCGCTAEPTF